MKKTFLFILTLFVFSIAISSSAQIRSTKKNSEEKSNKTENSLSTKSTSPNDTKEPVKAEILLMDYYPDYQVLWPSKNLKLKVTLVELQSAVTQNGKLAHLSINQHVRYESKGKVIKPISKDIQKKARDQNCWLGLLQLWHYEQLQAPEFGEDWEGATPLICGDRDNQIHVVPTTQPLTRNPNINHSLVFEITPDQANDKNAEFLIDTFVVEYSTDWKGYDTSIILNHDPRRMNVAIYDVLAILQGKKKLNENASYVKDGGVPASFKFDHFDGVSLPLRNVNPNGKMILEGPIRARNKDKELIEKAFVWMRFELID